MIVVNDVEFSYPNSGELFGNMHLSLSPGGIYGLLGKNGAGKTTLLKLLCGLSFPDEGTIEVGGFTPSQREVPFLSDIYFLGDEIWVEKHSPKELEMYRAPFYPKFNADLFKQLLLKLKVEYLSSLSEASYGEKKKAMIAFALACNTKYLLMDEPTNGLDIPSKAIFRSIIASTYDENRLIVIATHQVRDLQSLIDRVIILNEHRVQLDASLEIVSERFAFGHGSLIPEGVEVVYRCDSELGKSYIFVNNEHWQGQVDLETLFNGFISDPETFNQILNK